MAFIFFESVTRPKITFPNKSYIQNQQIYISQNMSSVDFVSDCWFFGIGAHIYIYIYMVNFLVKNLYLGSRVRKFECCE